MDSELEVSLRRLIEHIRENAPRSGRWPLPVPASAFPEVGAYGTTISLARFQSYRARTEAALLQELVDFVEDTNLTVLDWEIDDVVVHVW